MRALACEMVGATYNSSPLAPPDAGMSARSLRLAVQDAALSRLKRGFDSRRERQKPRRRLQPPATRLSADDNHQTAARDSHMPPRPPAAGLPRRLAAACYDLLLLGGLLITTSFPILIARGDGAVPAGNVAYQAFLAVQAAAFFIFFWWRGGQTLGMRAWNIRVEDDRGDSLRLTACCGRFAAALLSVAALGLGFLWALGDPARRTWHDRLSGSRVVRVTPRQRAGPGASSAGAG